MGGAQRIKCAQKINVDHCLEAVRRHASSRRGEIPRRSRYHAVNCAKLMVNLLKGRFQSTGVANVQSLHDSLATELLDVSLGFLELFFSTAGESHCGAMFGKALRNSQAYAASGSCKKRCSA